jgi:hypothetical protein
MDERYLIPSDIYSKMLRLGNSQTKDGRYIIVPAAMFTSPNLLHMISYCWYVKSLSF